MVKTQNLKNKLEVSCKSLTLTLPFIKENPLEITYRTKCEFTKVDNVPNGIELPLPFASSEVLRTNICAWRRLSALDERCKPIYEVAFDITGSNFKFRPGDTIGLIPQNEESEVDVILKQLDLASLADLPYILSLKSGQKGGKIPIHIPTKSTIRQVLTYCCDIRGVIKKLFLLALSRHTKDECEKKILEYLCSKEGSSDYTMHILNQNMCLLDIFTIFKSCKPPIECLLLHLPRLLPRPYSIVNSRGKDSNIIKICFSVMDIGNNRKGLVTGWLEKLLFPENISIEQGMELLNINSCKITVPIYMRKNMSSFFPPDDLTTPLILLGPGTGVAPFIGFLEERQSVKETCSGQNLGYVWLFFGCRDPKLDFIYEKEINDFVIDGTISKLSKSFSRVEDNESKYIQDALLKNGEEVVKLINAGASIYVCGDLKTIATQVKETIVNCLIKYNGDTRAEAEKLLSDMQTGKRYLVDAWS